MFSKKKMIKTIPLESGDVIVVNWNTVGHMAGWIETLYSVSKNLPKCGAVSALALTPDNKIFVHGCFITPRLYIPAPYGMGEEYFGQYGKTREVEATHFICGIIKKDLIKKLPLPENIGTNPFVDADYCLRAQKLGFKIYATPDLIVQYKGPIDEPNFESDYSVRFQRDYQKFKKDWGAEIDARYSLPVLYHTGVAIPSGFSMVARGYMRGLTENGVRVCYNFLKGTNEEEGLSEDQLIDTLCEDHGDLEMPQVIWAQAPYFNKNSGLYKIGHCEFEGDWVPESWVSECNNMDEIWVPTNWDREKFRHAGVNVPIYVIGQGIDPDYFNPEIAPAQWGIKEGFKFLCNAAWDPRKNLPNLITAFQNEFKKGEDVCLIIKTINLGLTKSIPDELKKIKNNKNGAKVYVKEENLPKEQLGCLYTGADALVFPTRGEAWGLPAFEALACGIPVITTGYGALNETLRDENGEPYGGVHFLRYQKTVCDTPYIYLQGNHWAEPSIPHLMETMRYVYEHRAEEKEKALKTSEIIRSKFNWRSISYPIKLRLEDIYKNKLGRKK